MGVIMWYEFMDNADRIVETSMIPTMLMLILSWIFAYALGTAHPKNKLEWGRKYIIQMIKEVCQSNMNNSSKLDMIWGLITRRKK